MNKKAVKIISIYKKVRDLIKKPESKNKWVA